MSESTSKYIEILKKEICQNYRDTFREAGSAMNHPFIVPGSQQYHDELWDWDSWLTNVSVRQVLADTGDDSALEEARPYERGCILNFIEAAQGNLKWLGWMPVLMGRDGFEYPEDPFRAGVHKPCLAQHAAFLTKRDGGDVDWLKKFDGLYAMQSLLNFLRAHRFHTETGLYRILKGGGNGIDDDPASWLRPWGSSGSISLNTMMYREMEALIYLLNQADLHEVASGIEKERDELKASIREHCWDERDGFYYSVDLNLIEQEPLTWNNSGRRRHYPCLIQRLGIWSGFMAMWAEVATPEQAERMVEEHYRDERTFHCPAGIRTLSKMEKMYLIRASGNPSCWLGPVWGIANYMTWHGLVKYGFEKDARDLCEKTIRLFGRDIEKTGALHEYYQPDNGEPVLNPGFQNWNHLVLNMIAWFEGREFVREF